MRIRSLNNSSIKTDSFDIKKLLNHNLKVILNLIGLKAYVDWDKGTDFGNALADTMVEKAWYKDLSSIFTRVSKQYIDITMS